MLLACLLLVVLAAVDGFSSASLHASTSHRHNTFMLQRPANSRDPRVATLQTALESLEKAGVKEEALAPLRKELADILTLSAPPPPAPPPPSARPPTSSPPPKDIFTAMADNLFRAAAAPLEAFERLRPK
jgi:hypothetical protein